MRHLYLLAPAVFFALGACDGGGGPADGSPQDALASAQQGVLGSTPNVLVRLLEGRAGDQVVCNARVRGVVASTGSSYKTTIKLTYPSAPAVERSAVVTLALPAHLDTNDGRFEVVLVETPPGSGEFIVDGSFKRATSERTGGAHRCDALVEEDAAGDPVSWLPVLNSSGEAAQGDVGLGASRQSSSHRHIGSHIRCSSRLNFADPAATHFIDVAVSNDSGIDSIADVTLDPTSPTIGPMTLGGGTLLVEWGTQSPPATPSVDVLYDFVGQALGSPSSCVTTITEGDPAFPLVLDGSTSAVECPAGFDECDGDIANGCESTTDTTNCGVCGNACAPAPSATAACSSGDCVYSCFPGMANCDESVGNGCECVGDLCCGNFCPTAHSNGLGQSYYDCNPLGTYDLAAAQAARNASNLVPNGPLGDHSGTCGTGPGASQCVARQSTTECAVWCYSTLLTGRVLLSAGCLCPNTNSPMWN